jgi:hypothetical protein
VTVLCELQAAFAALSAAERGASAFGLQAAVEALGEGSGGRFKLGELAFAASGAELIDDDVTVKALEAGAERVAIWPQELIAWLRTAGNHALVGASKVEFVDEPVCQCSYETQTLLKCSQDLVLSTGVQRREQVLQRRLAVASRELDSGFAMANRPDSEAAQDELRQALARIMGGPL